MFRLGLILNEHEASHSKYADTEATLKSAIEKCNDNGARGNGYHYVVYNKFNIGGLFDGSNADIATLDALVVATNALSFGDKVHDVVCANRARIEAFLDSGKGIFVSSQKKLSNGHMKSAMPRSVGFLPAQLDYYVFDRPEASSAEGDIRVVPGCPLLEYPYIITDQLVNDHCTNNQFMVHRYRSVIVPTTAHSFTTVLEDVSGDRVSQPALEFLNGPRNLLLCSSGNKRLVASTMALDWANHSELLCNILTYITENEPRIFFVRKSTPATISPIVSSYMIRANIANIPYRVIFESEVHNCATVAGDAFVFPPYWTSDEVRAIYSDMLKSGRKYLTIYHVSSTHVESDRNHKLSKYTNYSSIDLLKDEVIRHLLLSYHPTGWGRSVWTYSYVLSLFERCNIDAPEVAQRVYKELSLHFTRPDGVAGDRKLSGSYDGVVNATCKMLEVLSAFARRYPDTINQACPYDCAIVIRAGDEWLMERISAGAVFDQDICYCLLYLIQCDKVDRLNEASKTRLLTLFEQLLAKISEELLSGRIAARSSVDLCRIYQTLCVLRAQQMIGAERISLYLDRIETTLRDRQDIHGLWRNVSETAEVTLMLLESYEARRGMQRDGQIVNILITKGIEALHSQYDAERSNWADDIGTTATAMEAIALYDVTFNFSINDFFSDLRLHRETRARTSDDLAMERVRYFYEQINRLERDNAVAIDKLNQNETKAAAVAEKLSRTRQGLATAVSALVAVISLLGFLVVTLFISEKRLLVQIAKDLVSDWRAAVAGLIITSLFASLVLYLRKRLRS